MHKNDDTISKAKSENIHCQNFLDFKDFPNLKSTHVNHSSINEKIVNKGKKKVTKSYKSLFSYDNDSGKQINFNEAFPKLSNSKFKENQRSEGTDINKKEECKFQNPELEKCEAALESKVQAEVTKNEEKKLDSNKKVPPQQKRNPNKKKRSEPIFFNLGDFLELNLSRKKIKQPKKLKIKFQRSNKREIVGGNFLDSSNPKRNRGKHREIKKKKHTNLKMTIIKERIIKQKIKEENISDFCDENCVQLINSINFKEEMEKYLNNLQIKKSKNFEKKKKGAQENLSSMNKALEILNLNNKNENIKCHEQKIVEIKEKVNSNQIMESNVTDKCSLSKSSNKTIKFSSKFREYCDNILTPNLNIAVTELIKDLVDLQDRVFVRDPIKAKAKKRHVSGLREVKKYLTMKKVKMVVIAPNLEKLQMEGSVYDIIKELKILCDTQKVPCVFALDRYKLGRCTKKYVPVSAFAVLNYDGLEDRFKNVIKHLEGAKKEFSDKVDNKKVFYSEDVNTPVMSSLLSAFKENVKIAEVT